MEEMNIEKGDTVSYWEDGKMKRTWLTVLEINGEEAVCSGNVLPENMDERPSSLESKYFTFNLKDLRLVRKA